VGLAKRQDPKVGEEMFHRPMQQRLPSTWNTNPIERCVRD
jgi:hypothetical protein